MTIAKITDVWVRTYSDSGQTKAYVAWVDHKGETGRIEGDVRAIEGTLEQVYGLHMGALMARAICHGIEIRREVW